MQSNTVAVIAGGPVDSKMGEQFLIGRGVCAKAYPAAESAEAQTIFQMQPYDGRMHHMSNIIQKALQDGCSKVMIYCNSLSATVDTSALAREFGIPIITPLDAYAKYASRYHHLGVIAGNCQGLAGIERTVLTENAACIVTGISLYPVVCEIESQTPPQQIISRYNLRKAVCFLEAFGAQAIVLGCTHFPYLQDTLAEISGVELLDPSDYMYNLLQME